MNIRRMTVDDVDAVYAIEAATFAMPGAAGSSPWMKSSKNPAGTWMAGPSSSSRAPLATSSAALAMPTELALISARPSLRLLPRSQMP